MSWEIVKLTAVLFGIVLAALSVGSACWVWLTRQMFGFGGSALCASGVVFIGLSIWSNIQVTVSPSRGLDLKLSELENAISNAIDTNKSVLAAITQGSKTLADSTEAIKESVNQLNVALGKSEKQFAQVDANQIIQSLSPTGQLLNGSTRGIRLSPPSRAQPTTPAAGPSTPPEVNLTLEFASGSAKLTPQVEHELDKLGSALTSQELKPYRFRVEGYTDTVGTPEANNVLSQHRAEAVTAYLQKKFGIEPSRLEAIGMGEQNPIVPIPPQTAAARNRRVRVVNVGS